jgi:hypothetical protein
MILLTSLVYAESILVFDPMMIGVSDPEHVNVSIYSEHLRHVLSAHIQSDMTVLTKGQMQQRLSKSDLDFDSAGPVDIAKGIGADWMVTSELFEGESQKGVQIWFRSVELSGVIHEARLMSDSWDGLDNRIASAWQDVVPTNWVSSSAVLTIDPMHNELYKCLNESVVKDNSGLAFAIDAKASPSSNIYMPSAIGSIGWNSNGMKQQITWTSFGSTPETALENAKGLQQLKGTSVVDICTAIVQQTTQVKGK